MACPVELLRHRGFKEGNMNTQKGDSLLKHFYPEAVKMAVEAEWDEATEIIFTQEENSTEG